MDSIREQQCSGYFRRLFTLKTFQTWTEPFSLMKKKLWFILICSCSGWMSGVEIPTLPCTWLHPTSHQPWPTSLLLQKGGKLTAWCWHLHTPQREWCVPVDLECQFKAGGFLAQPDPAFDSSTAPPLAWPACHVPWSSCLLFTNFLWWTSETFTEQLCVYWAWVAHRWTPNTN